MAHCGAPEEIQGTTSSEQILLVPPDVAAMPLGFVIDAGGSLTKLIYRSKEDYAEGIPKHGSNSSQGRLRLREFQLGKDDDLLEFIRRNCDVMPPSMHRIQNHVWFQTGLNTPHFKRKLEDMFEIKTQMFSEDVAIMHCATELLSRSRVPGFGPFLPTSIETVDSILEYCRSLATGFEQMNQAGDPSYDIASTNIFLKNHLEKIKMTDSRNWLDEIDHQPLHFPCIVTNMGSCTVSYILQENGKYSPCYFDAVGGKSFIALGQALTGAKNFDELVEMAQLGDHRKVNVLGRDLKMGDGPQDWYDAQADEPIIFFLGKMTTDNKFSEGAYSQADLAAAILEFHCTIMTNTALLNARIHKIKSVVLVGAFVSRRTVRETVQRLFHQQSFIQFYQGLEEQISLHFLSNSAFICSPGVWFKNLE